MTGDDEYNAGARGKVIVQSEIRETVIWRRSAAAGGFTAYWLGQWGGLRC